MYISSECKSICQITHPFGKETLQRIFSTVAFEFLSLYEPHLNKPLLFIILVYLLFDFH